MWELCIHERVRDPTCRKTLEVEREDGYITHPELWMR